MSTQRQRVIDAATAARAVPATTDAPAGTPPAANAPVAGLHTIRAPARHSYTETLADAVRDGLLLRSTPESLEASAEVLASLRELSRGNAGD